MELELLELLALLNPKKYLKSNGFVIPRKRKARYKFRLLIDSLIALLYSGISIRLIIFQDIDLIIFGLNILCLFRAAIGNAICASDVTSKIKHQDIENEFIDLNSLKNNYYRKKVKRLSTALLYSISLWVLLFIFNVLEIAYQIDSGNPALVLALFVIYVTKFFASILILKVFNNDLSKNLIYAYDANIEFTIKKEIYL